MQEALTRGMIQTLLTSRSSLYHIPNLAGEVDGHGDQISKKVIEACKNMAKNAGMDTTIASEEIARPKGRNWA